VAVGIQPYMPLSFVEPLRQAEHRIKSACRFTKAGKNDFFVLSEVETFTVSQNLFFRRLLRKAEVVTVNSIAAFPYAEYAIGATPICYVEVEVTEGFIANRILAIWNVFVIVRHCALPFNMISVRSLNSEEASH